jgi:hypothetical protein
LASCNQTGKATAPLRLFVDDHYELRRRLMMAVDYCNARWCAGAVKVGLFPSSSLWRTKAAFDAPGRITQWGDLMDVV